MSSDGLSAEQLVQMTKDVQESLMAQVLISLVMILHICILWKLTKVAK